MKLTDILSDIHIMDPKSNISTVIQDITRSGFQEEPFYIFDIHDIVQKYLNWKKLIPRVETYYAVKCNDNPLLLKVLSMLNIGFDCATKGEIIKILNLGVSPEKIVFANPTKLLHHIKFAKTVGVSLMMFDNSLELDKIRRLYPKSKLVLRIKYDDEHATIKFGEKFGCCSKTEAETLLKKSKSLGLEVVGVSFHIGSGSKTVDVYEKAIKASRHVFDVARKVGYNFDFLDIGGGFPGEKDSSLNKIAHHINNALATYFPEDNIKIIAEPGTYYAKSAFTLLTHIHSIKDIELESGKKEKMYYITAGMYNGLLDNCFCQKFDLKLVEPPRTKEIYKSIIWGPTLDSYDKVSENVALPEMQEGDWFKIEEAGSYTISFALTFNSFPLPKVLGVAYQETLSYLEAKSIGEENDNLYYVDNYSNGSAEDIDLRKNLHELTI